MVHLEVLAWWFSVCCYSYRARNDAHDDACDPYALCLRLVQHCRAVPLSVLLEYHRNL